MKTYMTPFRGRGRELSDLLREALGVPDGVRSFSVHFETDDVVYVRCEYMPKADAPDRDERNAIEAKTQGF